MRYKYDKKNDYFGIDKNKIISFYGEYVPTGTGTLRAAKRQKQIGIILNDFVLLFTKELPISKFDLLLPLLDQKILLDGEFISESNVGDVNLLLIQTHNEAYETNLI